MWFRCFAKAACSLLLGALVGCAGPVNFWYRAGAVPNASNAALLQCRIDAANMVPINTQLATTPQYRTPVTTNCHNYGGSIQCNQSGGQVFGGQTYSYDANSDLRGQYANQCMNNQGYSYIQLRRCGERDLTGGIPQYSTLPSLSSNACAYESGQNDFVFINPPR